MEQTPDGPIASTIGVFWTLSEFKGRHEEARADDYVDLILSEILIDCLLPLLIFVHQMEVLFCTYLLQIESQLRQFKMFIPNNQSNNDLQEVRNIRKQISVYVFLNRLLPFSAFV